MIERGLKAEGRTLAPAEIDRLFQDFIAHYAAHIADHSHPFEGVEAALDVLAVKLQDVVPGQSESADRCLFAEASMRSVPVVAMQP
jgi:hypothetical protein